MKIIKIGVVGDHIMEGMSKEDIKFLPATVAYAIGIAEHELRIKYGDMITFQLVTQESIDLVGQSAHAYVNSPSKRGYYTDAFSVKDKEFMNQIDAIVHVGIDPISVGQYSHMVCVDFMYPLPQGIENGNN